ncbi:Lipopolysaccharide biosynthesis protein WzxC [Pseudonocardia sp. Ae717_Ps2]|uniref:lipopolysaccharide biosynthesis protein n=1 Tax=Pseudonocardia sp. Ae717_Ps2 TaxID=1885573 RepID=UPI00094AA594|nr:lipopolysaccharide biosynthesis protein [Pseudonocardia sp. Ae717_Ps2]OLM29401.1 Lipopolysaccharide biosynthesis protein WzxC [Pseudonocardia sp. Ae717_Ps2]
MTGPGGDLPDDPTRPLRPVPADPPPPGGPPSSPDRATGGPSLTTRTARGFAWAFTGTVGQAVLQIGATVALARLLTPDEFGAAAAALLVVGLTQLGVAASLVHRERLDDRDVTAAFWFSVLVAAVFAAVLAAGSPVLSPLVGLPADSGLLPLLSVALLFAGAAATPLGLLQRDLRFRSMATVDLVAAGPALIGVSVALAAAGFGATALAYGEIAAAVAKCVGYLVLTRPRFRPEGPAASWARLRPLLGYGAGFSLAQLGNWFALNADKLVVANALGTGPLGVYGRAYNLLSEPANIIGGAADKALFPAMARVRDDGPRLRAAYVRSASLVALVTVPAAVLLCVLAPEVVHVLLGDQWDAVVPLVQLFALVLLPRTSYKISTSLTRATGAVYRAAWRQWLYAGYVVVLTVTGGLLWGLVGVAAGASLAIVIHFLVMLQFSARVSPGLMGAVLRMYLKHVPALVLTVAATWGVATLVRPLGIDLVTLAVAALAGGIATLGTLVVLRGRFAAELGVVRSLRGGGAPRGPRPAGSGSGPVVPTAPTAPAVPAGPALPTGPAAPAAPVDDSTVQLPAVGRGDAPRTVGTPADRR